jgi:hypothetical protein
VAPPHVLLDLVRHLLRRLAYGTGLFLGVGEELARLLIGLAASLRAVGIDRGADVARIGVCLRTHALGVAGELLDPRGRIGVRLAENFVGVPPGVVLDRLGCLLGGVQNRRDAAACLGVIGAAVRGFLV